MKKFILLMHLLFCITYLWGQTDSLKRVYGYSVTNASELQYNISKGKERNPKYINLALAEATVSTDRWWKGGKFEMSFLSVMGSFDYSIADYQLMFSNIEEKNCVLICSKLGYGHTFGDVSLFAGIRNLNFDYFNSPYSSLFTNSSCGIFPTISINYGVANYPLSAFGFHGEYNYKGLSLKNSFYNNIANLEDREVFKFHFDPKRHGYMNLSQIQYSSSNGIYAAGLVLDKLPQNSIRQSYYGLVEQTVLKLDKKTVGVIGQLGYAPRKYNSCYAYYGAGVVVSDLFQSDGKDTLGLIAFRANMDDGSESAVELTYKYTINSFISIQPAFHYIHSKGSGDFAGLLRGVFSFGS